ncbi:hypothetical protein [Saccharibacter floricola]|uniref:Uncharacterized protein n=1 Tax=Saccharibacter floricola DSM 15669 TaxID=1123227 RepID=A0ABQ0NX94_9PROT|nr:hypothetical protein [Saccharibacter floricola]GBQ04964.1 hypothetical protein AA15669_0244 [Saccharibacter floricola DSM 15669]
MSLFLIFCLAAALYGLIGATLWAVFELTQPERSYVPTETRVVASFMWPVLLCGLVARLLRKIKRGL